MSTPPRSLARTLSDTSDLDPWQARAIQDLQGIRDEAHAERRPLVRVIQAMGTYDHNAALEEIAAVLVRVTGCTTEDGQQKASLALANTHTTTVHAWRYDDESLWRGPSDNQKLVRIARSIICTGFHGDEPIVSRSPGAPPRVSALLFGDGQARGLAARLAWQVLLQAIAKGDVTESQKPSFERVLESLLRIPTVFEVHGDGSDLDMLVAQAVKQNVKAKTQLPMNTLEWANLVLRLAGVQLPSAVIPADNSTLLLATLQKLVAKYDGHVDITAHDMEPTAKRARKGRRKVGATQEADADDQQDRLKIGFRRKQALTNLLKHCTQEGFQAMQEHLVWAGNYKYSAFSDEAFCEPSFWPGSSPHESSMPSEVEQLARDASRRTAEDSIPAKLKKVGLPLAHAINGGSRDPLTGIRAVGVVPPVSRRPGPTTMDPLVPAPPVPAPPAPNPDPVLPMSLAPTGGGRGGPWPGTHRLRRAPDEAGVPSGPWQGGVHLRRRLAPSGVSHTEGIVQA